jgi:hypothetical protein
MEIKLTDNSGEQGQDCRARRIDTAYKADELSECRGAMQCRWMHYESGNARRQQGEDSKIRRFGTLNKAGKVKGYACAAKCDWGVAEHDTFRYVIS